ncbi:hypothetical protein ATE62_08690 [Sphingopyxis sp. HIX]|nr:hypothetical protein ATE62_08690 [Sphingopyxis sp. HIX]KTE84845.1 hypothetical protein ATE72_06665 [Sphingopyxis sp. HXXIV]
MISMTDDAAIASALQKPLHPELLDLIRRRRAILGDDMPFAEMAHFVVVEPGDTIDATEAVIRWPIRPNPDCGLPQWEWVLVHEGVCYETVFVLSDDGYAVVLFVQIADGMDPELMGMLRAFCT